MSKTYFISDLHFGYENIMKYCPKFRDFKSVLEMDEYLIALWNDTVRPQDVVYDLCDFSFHDGAKTKQILKQLNGTHHLIYGNHDKVFIDDDFSALIASAQPYLFVRESGWKRNFALFHYPILEWQNMQRGAIHLYRHVHDHGAAELGDDKRAFNVCYDFNGRFLELDELVAKAEQIPLVWSER